MRLRDHIQYLGWSTNDLAAQAKITKITAARALTGQRIRSHTAQAIAKALSEALETKILPGDIEGLQMQHTIKEERTTA